MGNKAVTKKMENLKEERIQEKIKKLRELGDQNQSESDEKIDENVAEVVPEIEVKLSNQPNDYDAIDGFANNRNIVKSNMLLEDPRDPDFAVEFKSDISGPIKPLKSGLQITKTLKDEDPILEEMKLDDELIDKQETNYSPIDAQNILKQKSSGNFKQTSFKQPSLVSHESGSLFQKDKMNF